MGEVEAADARHQHREDQFAATGVLLVASLSFIVTYLIAPASEWLRHTSALSRRGRPLSRGLATLVIYGIIAAIHGALQASGHAEEIEWFRVGVRGEEVDHAATPI